MPLPLILAGIGWGLAALAGAGFLIDAREDNDKADELNRKARNLYDKGEDRLNGAREHCAKNLEALGRLRRDVNNSQISRATDLFGKFHNVESSGGVHVTGLPPVSTRELQETFGKPETGSRSRGSNLLIGGGAGALVAAGGYGVAAIVTGSAGAATVAWLGGGSVAAGSVLLGGLFVAPAILVAGIVKSAKARENLANAERCLAEVKEEATRMSTAAVVLDGLSDVANQYRHMTERLSARTSIALDELEGVIKRRWFIHPTSRWDYSKLEDEDRRTLYAAYEFTKGLKELLQAPIMRKDGAPRKDYQRALKKSRRMLDAEA